MVKKVEFPILYNRVGSWFFRGATKKWNCLCYGEILVAPMNDKTILCNVKALCEKDEKCMDGVM